LISSEAWKRLEPLRKRANESEEALQEAYVEAMPYASYVGTETITVKLMREVLKNHPELIGKVRETVEAHKELYAARYGLERLEDAEPRLRRQDRCVDNLIKVSNMLGKWKRR